MNWSIWTDERGFLKKERKRMKILALTGSPNKNGSSNFPDWHTDWDAT